MNNNLLPINRINKFFSADDYNFHVEVGREYIESHINMVVVLYQVDRNNSSIDDIYGESSKEGIRYKTPVELRVAALLAKPENKTYNDNSGGLRYLQDGMLSFTVFNKQLEELDVDVNYGDYVGYQVSEREMRYFNVVDDGKKNYNNANTIFGYKSAYRVVRCSPVDDNEFQAL